MVKSVVLGKEIVVSVVNEIGVLAELSRVLADHGVNIDAVAGYAEKDNTAKIMIVTDDGLRASDALRKAGYKSLKENEVVIVELENKPGALKQITKNLASEGIDIKQVYGTTCKSGCPARIILSTNNNQKALLAFKK